MCAAWTASRTQITWARALLWSFSAGSRVRSWLCCLRVRPRTWSCHCGWRPTLFIWFFGPGKAAAWTTWSLFRILLQGHCSAIFLASLSPRLPSCLLFILQERRNSLQWSLLLTPKRKPLASILIHWHFLLHDGSFCCCFVVLSPPYVSFYSCSIPHTNSSPLASIISLVSSGLFFRARFCIDCCHMILWGSCSIHHIRRYLRDW